MRLQVYCLPHIAFVIFAFLVSACTPHRGMYRHQPELLWELPPTPDNLSVIPCALNRPLVIKRFDNAFAIPVGADFKSERPSAKSMTQSYTPRGDLGAALFDATFNYVKYAGCQVWKDYDPNPYNIKGPMGSVDFDILAGIVQELEVSTFEKPALMEGARAVITFFLLDSGGNVRNKFTLEEKIRIRRGQKDVLDALGQHLANHLLQNINER